MDMVTPALAPGASVVTTEKAGRLIMTVSLSAGGRFVNGMSRTSISGGDCLILNLEGICNLSDNRIMLDFVQFRSPMKVKMKESKASFQGLTSKLAPKMLDRNKVGLHE